MIDNRKYKSIEIRSCRSCSSKKLKKILNLGNFYLSDFTKTIPRNRKQYPLELILCRKCSLLQLRHTTPPRELYTERYGYKSGVSNTMKEELRDVVLKTVRFNKLNKGDLVIDIGANDGTLLSFYPKNVKKMAVEPVKKFAIQSKRFADTVVNDYFNLNSVRKQLPKDFSKAKIITAIAMFYDLEDPNSFLQDVKKLLDKDGIFVIQQNYLLGMLKLKAFDNIVHEHLEYYSLRSLESLLNKNGLKVFHVEALTINGGSFRTYVSHKESKYNESASVRRFRQAESKYKLDTSKPYDKFASEVEFAGKSLLKTIKKIVKSGKTVYVYGASTRGNTLLQYSGINKRLISAAVERNPEKWGKFITSVEIPIISEKEARKSRPDYMLALPWFFKEEFLKRENDYLELGGKFIFPLPWVQIVSRKKSG